MSMRTVIALLVALSLVVGCRRSSSTTITEPPPDPVGDAPPFGLTDRVPVEGLAFPLDVPEPLPLVTVLAFPDLVFQMPTFLTSAPDGTNRLFVTEQEGRIEVFEDSPSSKNTTVFLDISSQILTDDKEEGLLGLAFHPDYRSNGLFYVYYTADVPRRSVLSSFQVTGDPDRADESSEKVLLELEQPAGNHNAGMIAFGPDGKLYVALGDGGGSNGDPARDRTSLLGTILRIDVDSADPYGIPDDNPFVGEGGGVREEIWAYGFRNPWRFSFDSQHRAALGRRCRQERARGDRPRGPWGRLRLEHLRGHARER